MCVARVCQSETRMKCTVEPAATVRIWPLPDSETSTTAPRRSSSRTGSRDAASKTLEERGQARVGGDKRAERGRAANALQLARLGADDAVLVAGKDDQLGGDLWRAE